MSQLKFLQLPCNWNICFDGLSAITNGNRFSDFYTVKTGQPGCQGMQNSIDNSNGQWVEEDNDNDEQLCGSSSADNDEHISTNLIFRVST